MSVRAEKECPRMTTATREGRGIEEGCILELRCVELEACIKRGEQVFRCPAGESPDDEIAWLEQARALLRSVP